MWSTSRPMFFNDFEGSLNFSNLIQFSDDTVIYYSGKWGTNIEVILTRDPNPSIWNATS